MKKILTLMVITALLASCEIVTSVNSSEERSSTMNISSTSTVSSQSIISSPVSWEDKEWNLVFADEFDYEGEPDQQYWGYETGGHGFGNNELQHYTTRRENSNVKDGVLTITALQEQYGGNDYTSAKIVTTGKKAWKHGRIDIKAKVPVGRGNWPAIWMMPEVCGTGWPKCGEIDIMEHVGYEPNVIHGTIHTAEYNHMKGTQKGASISVPTANSDFVVYSFVWRAEEIWWYANDILFNHYTFTDLYRANIDPFDLWPLNQEYRLMLNLAIGGDWGGQRGVDTSSAIWPQEYVIDYVRVYEEVYANDSNAQLSKVNNLRTTSIGTDRVSVKWDTPELANGFDKYNIYLNNTFYATSEVSSIFLTDLELETDYSIDVEVVDKMGIVSPKNTVEFKTKSFPTINENIEAEDYITQKGGTIQDCGDTNGGYNIGNLSDNDYSIYEVNIPETGAHIINLRVATAYNSRKMEIFQDDVSLGTVSFNSTGGWHDYEDILVPVNLIQKNHSKIKIVYKTGAINFNYWAIYKNL